MLIDPQVIPDPTRPSTDDAALAARPAPATSGGPEQAAPAGPESRALAAAEELARENALLRQTIAELEASRERYRELYETAPVGYLTLGRDGRIGALNRAAASLLGAAADSLLEQRFERLVEAESLAAWQRQFMQSWRTGEPQFGDLKLRRDDGSVFVAQLDSAVVGRDAQAALALTLIDISDRWLAEQALQESETRFRATADAAPVLIWMSDPETRCAWVNQEWLKFTGRPLALELGYGWIESLHPEDRQRCQAAIEEAFARRAPFEIEYRLRHADGTYRWLLDRGQPRYGADQKFLGYIGSCVDITYLKQGEQDLNHAQSVGHIGSWRLDVRRNELTWSRENHRIFGVPEGVPLSYETFLGAVHPEDAAAVDRAWHAALGGAPYELEHRIVVDGKVKWVREKAELEFDSEGRLRGGFGITQDITEITLARQAIQAGQERFRAFMTHSPAVSWIVDLAGCFQYASPSYYKMFRLPFADVVGKTIAEVYPPEIAAVYLRGNQAVFDGGQPVESIMPGLRVDGGLGEFLVIKFMIRDARGEPLLCGMALDVTEERQATAALRHANQRLVEVASEQAADLRELADKLANAEQSERDQLYELLHDDVQPMLVAARLSLSSLNPATPAAEVGRVVSGTCQQISQVIEVARTLGRHLSPPLIREQGLKAALESHCQWVDESYGLPVDLFCSLDAEPEDVSLRLFCFGAVRELLFNVVKHAAAPRVCVTLQSVEPAGLQIAVADSGHGFDSGAITAGTGLAAIARRIGLLGGRFRVDSRPGHGTVARLYVPLSPPKGEAVKGKSYSDQGGENA